MPSIVLTDTTPGSVSDANANLNNNWSLIENLLNGGLDSANLAADAVGNSELAPNAVTNTEVAAAAAIAYSKLSLAGSLVDADVATAAAVAVSKLAGGAGGEQLRSVGTVPTWVDPEVAYQEFTAITVIGTSEGAATAVVSAGAIDYEAVPHLIEFFSPRIQAPISVGLFVVLYDGTTPLGELTVLDSSNPRTTRGGVFSVRLTPTAASHTYNVKAYVGSGSGLVDGGAGGAGARVPGYIRITRV